MMRNPKSNFYALYNPQLFAFELSATQELAFRAKESKIREYLKKRNKIFEAIDKYYDDYGYYPYRPGLRFISPDNIKHRFNDTIDDRTPIKVDFKELYDSLDNYINKNIPLHFYTLPQLMLLLIDDETRVNMIGSSDHEFIRLCEGVSNLIPKEELPDATLEIKVSRKQ